MRKWPKFTDRFQHAAERGAELRVLQAERDIGFEIAELVAAIVAPGGGAQPVKRLAGGDQPVEPVGQLDLVAAAGLQRGQMRRTPPAG